MLQLIELERFRLLFQTTLDVGDFWHLRNMLKTIINLPSVSDQFHLWREKDMARKWLNEMAPIARIYRVDSVVAHEGLFDDRIMKRAVINRLTDYEADGSEASDKQILEWLKEYLLPKDKTDIAVNFIDIELKLRGGG